MRQQREGWSEAPGGRFALGRDARGARRRGSRAPSFPSGASRSAYALTAFCASSHCSRRCGGGNTRREGGESGAPRLQTQS